VDRIFRGLGLSNAPQDRVNRGWLLVVQFIAVFGFVLIFLYGVSQSRDTGQLLAIVGGAGLLAMGAALMGTVVGFLFGLPRSPRGVAPAASQSAPQANTQQGTPPAGTPPAGTTPSPTVASPQPAAQVTYGANTNLEDISDWLTKILVGVGLTQLPALSDKVNELVTFSAQALGSGTSAQPVAAGLLGTYFVLGFMGTYLWARLRLAGALALSDAQQLRQELEETKNEQAQTRTLARQAAEGEFRRVAGELASRTGAAGSGGSRPMGMGRPSGEAPLTETPDTRAVMEANPNAISDEQLVDLLGKANAALDTPSSGSSTPRPQEDRGPNP
jgi:hypothetical protein